MKKLFISVLVLSGFCLSAKAQTAYRSEIGVNIGLNQSTVQYTGTGENADYRAGINLGISGEYYFSDRWGIKAKVIYDQKGWGNGYLVLSDGTQINGVDYHLDYITIPMMANWHFGRTRNWYLDFGPYLGFLASSSETSHSADVSPLFNSTDVGIAFGIGVKIPVSNRAKLFFEYDGQGGLTNVFTQSDGTYQNIRSSLNFGVIFPLQ
ncbi:MAG: PorT family protein [Bacteroidetes bacterium]|nr:PorT family protein [Bacteroidota bacterium]